MCEIQNIIFTCKRMQGLKLGLQPTYLINYFIIIFKCILSIQYIQGVQGKIFGKWSHL